MKCEFCGGNLQIEDAKCPHCGADNPHYIQHRADMKAYEMDYQSTREEVLENAARVSRRTVQLTVIAVLVALCAVAFVICLMGDRIQDLRIENNASRNRSSYEAQLQEYMQDVDPAALCIYARRHRLTYTRAMSDYDHVFSISSYYSYFYENVMELVTERADTSYYTLEERCETISRHISYIYQSMERNNYDPDSAFTEDKVAYMQAVAGQMETLLRGYFGLTEEEIAQLPATSASRLAIMLEEGYSHEK